MEPWASHEWRYRPRLVSINAQSKLEFYCEQCNRRFVEIIASGVRFVAFPSILDFEPLVPDVTARWLSEFCPGRALTTDADAFRNRPRLSSRW